MSDLAPIAFFAFTRPEHSRLALESIQQADLSAESELYIFVDGPREGNDSDKSLVKEVQEIAKEKKWCGTIHYEFSESNKGLAKSIIDGVSKIVKKHGKVIVIEDDLVVSSSFLVYMNSALKKYQNINEVMHISGYMHPIENQNLADTFFYPTASCWGWGTWDSAWKHMDENAAHLFTELESRDLMGRFTLDGVNKDKLIQLQRVVDKTQNTWAIRWDASVILQDGFSLHPKVSLVRNIGHDKSGIHNNHDSSLNTQVITEKVLEIADIPIEDSKQAMQSMKNFYRNNIPAKWRIVLASIIRLISPSPNKG